MRTTGLTGALVSGALLVLWPASAQAQAAWWTLQPSPESAPLPDATAPPSLLDLTHRGSWYGLETTFASIKPHSDAQGRERGRSFAWSSRLEGEWSLLSRRWYLGASHSLGYGHPTGESDAGGTFLVGYPEIWTRAVWASRSGLAYGGGLSAVIPLFKRSTGSDEVQAADSVRVVRPWDFAPFAENTFSLQPYLDARVIDGRVTFQLRQGFVVQGLVAEARLPDLNVVSRTTLYLGYRPSEYFALGLELQEVYFISADLAAICSVRGTPNCDDSLRAVFAVSPSVRLLTRVLQPSISALFPFDHTLFDGARSYWGLRLGFGGIYDD